MSKRNKQKRVLLALGWYDYRTHRGIERFAFKNATGRSPKEYRDSLRR